MTNGKSHDEKTWSEFTPEARTYLYELNESRSKRLRNTAYEASLRKLKYLTAINAGGVISTLSYAGVSGNGLNGFLLVSIILFTVGLILNGIVMFMAAKRLVSDSVCYDKIANEYFDYESTMTTRKRDDKTNECLTTDVKLENGLEGASFICFIGGIIVALLHFYLLPSVIS